MTDSRPKIVITIKEARNLPENKGKKLDFYIRIKNSIDDKQTFQTQTKCKTNEPVWNETFEIILPETQITTTKEIYFHIWSQGIVKESIGRLTIEVQTSNIEEQWYMLNLDKKWGKNCSKSEMKVKVDVFNCKQSQEEIQKEHDQMVKEREESILTSNEFEKKYRIHGNKELGEGSFSVVVVGEIIETKERVAIKKIMKKDLEEGQLESVKSEIDLMRKLKHKNIVRLLDTYETDEYLYLIMEYAEGGELYDRLCKSTLRERQAACVMYQLVSAIVHLHTNNIAHRDLKPENILIVYNNGFFVKIADFVLSKDFSNSMLQTCCGTPCYVAPEVIKGEVYTCQCDVWSLGIIAYLLVSGSLPFFDEDEEVVFDKILEGEYSFDDDVWQNVSVRAKDFISKCLQEYPDERPTSFELLKHSWINSNQVKLDVNDEMNEEKNRFSFDEACGYVSKQGKTLN